MKIERLAYAPETVLDFYETGLAALGAVCARTWHDRLEVLAEGRAAALWHASDELLEAELHFVPPGAPGARNAAREIFPGCPLTFGLAEALRPAPIPLERLVLAGRDHEQSPSAVVAEKLWRTQFPNTARWQPGSAYVREHHFSLVALARCEIQAIDQHWSLHRVAVGLPNGEIDEPLAREIGFADIDPAPSVDVAWPAPVPQSWSCLLQQALEQDLTEDLASLRGRQHTRLSHELARIDDYFESYERELNERAARHSAANPKVAERLAAARVERTRHRTDQVARHEIVVQPHIDALLLVAEPAWRTTVRVSRAHAHPETLTAHFIPRARRWVVLDQAETAHRG
ncbi:MAG TPA: hypothetical protein VGA56_25995 [Opitutaceae bacterium]